MKPEYIIPYLLHKVKVSKIHYLHTGEGIGSLNHILTTKSDKYKLHLRPLADLTKFRTFNGKSQIFMECYFQISEQEETDFYNKGEIPSYWKTNIKVLKSGGFKHLEYWIIEKLFKWHFDVFGLIDKGLAVDINTLKDG